MSSPGGEEVGRVSIRVVPDASGFRRQLQRDLDAAEAGLSVTVPVDFDVDLAGLRAQLAALDNSRVTIPVFLDADVERLRTQLRALDNSRLTIPVDLDLQDVERLQARLAALDAKDVRISVEVAGVAKAAAELEYLQSLTNLLDGKTVVIDIDVRGLAAAVVQMGALSVATTALGAFSRGSGGLGSLTSGFSGLASGIAGAAQTVFSLGVALAQASAIATAVAVGGAAITAAFGAAATAIAVLPAAIALIGAPLGLLLLDMDALKKRVGELTPAFQAFRTEATNAVANGLAPALETLANSVLPKVKGGLLGVATTMGQVAQKAAEWAATGPGIDLINGILANVNRTITNMLPGLGNIGIAFLELANQSGAFDVLSGAVNAFGESFRANVERLIGDGTMQAAFEGLGQTAQIAARGFSDLVTNGIELFAAAAPGVNALLESITGLFNRFDWTSLGTSVGGVFQGLADAINSVPQGTIDAIEASFSRLAQTFQSADFQAQIQTMISGIPAAIDLINQLVQVFGTIGAGVSIAIQAFERIGSAVSGLVDVIHGTVLAWDVAWNALAHPIETFQGKFRSELDQANSLVTGGMDKLGHAFTDPWPTIGAQGAAAAGAAASTIPEAVLGPLRGVPGAINTLNPQIASAVSALGGQSANAAEHAMQGVPPAVVAPLEPVPGQVTSALAPAEQAANTATANIGNVLQTGAAKWGPQVDAGLQGISASFQVGTAQWSTTVGTAITGVSVAITTGLAGTATAATTGMTGVTTAIATGTANWVVAAMTGMTALQLTVQAGFVTLTTTATTGMTGVQTAITTGTAGWAAAIAAGLAGLSAQVAAGFQLMAAVATGGMVAVTASITSGFAGAGAAVTAGMASMAAAVQAGFAQINASVAAGMAQVQAALTVNWSAAVAAVTAAMVQMTAVIMQGTQQQTAAITQGTQQMVQAITNGMNSSVQVVTSGVSRMLSALNGAVGQFRAAGANMGQALADGLNSKAGAVEAAAQRLANAAAAAVRAAAGIHSPSRVFMALGDQMGAGMELGLHDARAGIIREAAAIVDGLHTEFQKTDTSAVASAFDGDALHARVSAEVASDGDSLLHEVRALRGDADQSALLGQLVALQRESNKIMMKLGVPSAAATAQASRTLAELGAF